MSAISSQVRPRSHEAWDVGLPRLARHLANSAFLLVLAVLVFAPLAGGAVSPWSQGLIMIAVALAALLWVISLCLGRETHIVFSTMNAPVLVLMTYGIVRYSTSDVEALARPHMLAIVTVSLIFFLVLNTIRSRWQIMALVWGVAGIGVVLSLHAFWQVLRGGVPGHGSAASATFPAPGMLAVYLHLVFAVAGAAFLFSRRTVNERVIFAFAALLAVVGLALTQMHWNWISWSASACVLAIYLLRKRGWKFRWVLVGGGTLLVVLVAAVIVVSRFELGGAESGALPHAAAPQTDGSVAVLVQLLQIGQRQLATGVGPGLASWLLPVALPGSGGVVGTEFATLFAEYGAIGVVLLLWALMCYGLLSIRLLSLRAVRYSAATPSNRYAFAVAGLAMFVAVVLDCAIGTGLHAGANLLTFSALAAAALTCGIHHRGSLEERPPKLGQYSVVRIRGIPRYVLIGGLVALIALLVSRVHYSYPAHLLVQLAERKKEHLRWGQAESFYKRAWQLDSRNFAIAEGLADLFAARATWNSIQREQLSTEAIRWYRRAITLNPHNYDALVKKARMYDLLGQTTNGREDFEQAVAARPRRAEYHTELGLHHQRVQDIVAARRSFERALQLDPNDERAAHQLNALHLAVQTDP